MCRSPFAVTLMSMSEWRESWSSMWSKKPTPVEKLPFPVPSRSTVTVISVSFVLRSTRAVRIVLVAPGRGMAPLRVGSGGTAPPF